MLPLLHGKLTSGHDSLFYPPRVVTFEEGLKEGRILPRWTQEFAGGYGEPYFNFSPPLLYYVTSLFRFAGAGVIDSLNFAVAFLLLLSGFTMYLLAAEIFDRAGGLVAGAAYMYAPYTLTDIYVRAAYAEFSSFATLPLIFWSFYKLAQTRQIRYLIAAACSYALLLLCHNPVSLIFTPFLLLMILLSALRQRSRAVLLSQSAAFVLGLALSAFFWAPSLLEKKYIQIERLLQNALEYQNHFVYFRQLFNSPWGYGISTPGPNDGMSFEIGAFYLAALGVGGLMLLMRRLLPNREQRWFVALMLIMAAASIFFMTEASSIAWAYLPPLQYLQFPWRFLVIVAMASSILAAVPSVLTRGRGRFVEWLPVLIIPVIILTSLSKCKPNAVHPYKDDFFKAENIIARKLETSTVLEYRPKWVQNDPPGPPASPLDLTAGSARLEVQQRSQTRYRFQIDARTPSYFRFNVHYFPGWRVEVDGVGRDVEPNNRFGLMEFSVEPGVHDVVARFQNTPIRTTAEAVSQFSIVMILILSIYACGEIKARASVLRSEDLRPTPPRYVER